ncbi:MAG: enoyl-CoA hydratase-related protein [Caulobacterales bacterium]
MAEPGLVTTREEGLCVVRLNRPERLNAIGGDMLDRFTSELLPAAQDPGVRCILLIGAGRAFCAGGDVGTLDNGRARESRRDAMRAPHVWVKALRQSDAIVVSAVNGAAAGGGFGIALLADIVLASSAAFFKAGFADLGLSPDYGLGFTLPRAIGELRAAEILFSDRRVKADEALSLGMVSRVYPEQSFEADAFAFARKLAQASAAARLTKRLLRLSEREAFAAYLEAEAEAQADAFDSADFKEGAAAFLEKRAPRFRGE